MHTARLGLIGSGFIGEVHLRALRYNTRAQVRALADVDERRVRQAQEAFEKPIATTIADAERIIEVTRQRKVKLMLGFILRFTLPYLQLRQKVTGGELG